ncbi:MAG: hypothetical protein AAFO83_00965 [Cyanobacteria bacterium J06607_13]
MNQLNLLRPEQNTAQYFAQAKNFTEAKDNALEVLRRYCSTHSRIKIGFSGGKDSTALLYFVYEMVSSGALKLLDEAIIEVVCVDTLQEYPGISSNVYAAKKLIDSHPKFSFVLLTPSVDHQFLPTILGRGVPPTKPSMGGGRWCTRSMKRDPQKRHISSQGDPTRVLVLTGVRFGESISRDDRIKSSCSSPGGECGSSWYQDERNSFESVLAPIASWRYCHVIDWLVECSTKDYPVWDVLDTYGIRDDTPPGELRTGCIGCPVVNKDKTLEYLIESGHKHLEPLEGLHDLYWELLEWRHRYRFWGKRNADKSIPLRGMTVVGPLTLKSRCWAFGKIMQMQRESHIISDAIGRDRFYLLREDQISFIKRCWSEGVFPSGWDKRKIIKDERAFREIVTKCAGEIPLDFEGVIIPALWDAPPIKVLGKYKAVFDKNWFSRERQTQQVIDLSGAMPKPLESPEQPEGCHQPQN